MKPNKTTIGAAVRKTLVVACVTVLIASCSATTNQANPVTNDGPVLAETNKVYGLVEGQAAATRLRNAGTSLGYTQGKSIQLKSLGMVMVPFDLPQDVTGKQAITDLEAAVPQSTVGVNHAYQLQNILSQSTVKSYANPLLNWPQGGCQAQRPIGLIDGGIDTAAIARNGVTLQQRSFVTPTVQGLRHGTETAQVIVDPTRITNPTVFSANVVSQTEDGAVLASATKIVEALDWLVANDVRVANVSLAGPFNKLLALGVMSAAKRDLVLVAAAGNDRRVASVQYPAALPDVIAVTAIDARKRAYRTAVRGDHIDLAAPGVDIFVGDDAEGRFVTGTSMAAPFVSALLAIQPQLDVASLTQSGLDLGQSGKDPVFGYGLVQAGAGCTN